MWENHISSDTVKQQQHMMTSKPKIVTLTLNQRYQLIKEAEAGKSQHSLASSYGVSLGSVNRTLKRKREVLDAVETNSNLDRKRIKANTHEDLNNGVMQWFTIARSKNIPITGPLIQEKALKIASDLHLAYLTLYVL